MTRDEREQLLARYTTGELTPLERERLFSEALLDQSLFEELFEEDALGEALADPALRRHVLNAAPSPAPAWPIRWRWTVLAGLAASLFLAVFLIQRQITPSSRPELLASARPPVARDIEPLRSPAPESLELSSSPAPILTLKRPAPPPATAALSAPTGPPEMVELAGTNAAQPRAAAAGRSETAATAADSTFAYAAETRALPQFPAPAADMAAKSLAAPPPFHATPQVADPDGRWRPLLQDEPAPVGTRLRVLITASLPVTVSIAGHSALVLPGQPRPFTLPALAAGEHDIRLQWAPAGQMPTTGTDGPRPRMLSGAPSASPAPAAYSFRLRVE
jgi:hypothetical protein